MRAFRVLVVGKLLSAFVLSAGLSPAFADDVLHTQRELSRVNLQRSWSGRAILNPRRDKVRHLVADEQVVFVQATSGVVTAFSAENGQRLWSLLVGLPDQESYPITTNDDIALYASGMHLYAINKFTGDVLWELLMPHHPSTMVTADDDYVYAGMVDGSVYSFDLRTIHKLYVENRLPQWTHLALRWRYQTPAEIISPPISTGRIVVFASLAGSVYAVGAEDNQLVFEFETDAPIRLPMGRNADSVFVASDDARVFCLDLQTGATQWAFTSGNPIRKPVRVVGRHVYLAPAAGGMYCISAASGLRLWHQRLATEFISATADSVYVSDGLGNLLMLDRENGVVLGSLPARSLSVRLANERTDRLFLSTEDGLVVALHETGREFPLYHMHPERRPLLPDMAPETTPDEAPAEAVEAAPETN